MHHLHRFHSTRLSKDEVRKLRLLDKRYKRQLIRMHKRYKQSERYAEHDKSIQMYTYVTMVRYVLQRQRRRMQKERMIYLGPLCFRLPSSIIRKVLRFSGSLPH